MTIQPVVGVNDF